MLELYDSEIVTPTYTAGENVACAYSYLFLFDRPAAGDEDHYVPDNDRIRILAMSLANENPAVKPAQLLYDVLPSLRSTTNCRSGSLTLLSRAHPTYVGK